ncbi:MAG: hypothetical protein M3H12_02570, partial [Chromatiales bacterium]
LKDNRSLASDGMNEYLEEYVRSQTTTFDISVVPAETVTIATSAPLTVPTVTPVSVPSAAALTASGAVPLLSPVSVNQRTNEHAQQCDAHVLSPVCMDGLRIQKPASDYSDIT